ncbi:MAG TPA: hypothetical protein DCM86_19805 [Verrucomicrobiales bacterium]|nr:hypothetical protein [Verrucomicrobiales bacterium]
MQTQKTSPKQFEFYFSQSDTLILVEDLGDEVVVRATRNTFSPERKLSFIHELASEGFIPESYRWFSGFSDTSMQKVSWVIDGSWLRVNPKVTARATRFTLGLVGGAALLWGGLMALLLWRS